VAGNRIISVKQICQQLLRIHNRSRQINIIVRPRHYIISLRYDNTGGQPNLTHKLHDGRRHAVNSSGYLTIRNPGTQVVTVRTPTSELRITFRHIFQSHLLQLLYKFGISYKIRHAKHLTTQRFSRYIAIHYRTCTRYYRHGTIKHCFSRVWRQDTSFRIHLYITISR